MLRKWISVATASLLLVSGTPGALAQAKRRPGRTKTIRAAVLPVRLKGLPGQIGRTLGTVVFKELREIGVFKLVPGKSTWNTLKRLQKKKIYGPGCEDRPKCIRAVGRALRAKVVYHLTVAKAAEGITLSMRTFDVRSGQEVRQGSEHATDESEDLSRATRWLARRVSSPMITTLAKGKGRLQVDCNEEGANVFINGKSFGKRTGKSFKVSSGVFDVEVKKEGFAVFHDVVVIKPEQTRTIQANLVPDESVPAPLVATDPGGKTTTGPRQGDEGKKPDGAKEDKKADLPAWAVFEKKKKPEPLDLRAEKKKPDDATKTADLMPWQQVSKKKEPYLPDEEKKPEEEPARPGERKFYQTWWFWTIIGVAVAGAGGTATYFLLKEDGGGGSGLGSAVVSWP